MQNEELMMEILLEEVVKKRASDLHIQVGLPPMLRVDGSLSPVAGTQPLDEATVERLVFRIQVKLFQDNVQSINLFL